MNKKNEDSYTLKPSEKHLSFPLNTNTKSNINALFLYKNGDGVEYLTFQNPNQNEIYFYDINNEQLEFKISPSVEGANGVGFFTGYYIHNLDSIYVTNSGMNEIALINRNAIVKDKIQYEKTEDGIQLTAFCATSGFYKPMMVINNKMYILSEPNRWAEKNPVCVTIDMDSKNVYALPFTYPRFPNTDNKMKRSGIETFFSRCFNGEQFVYSFHFDEYIYVASIDHASIKKMQIKSKYIKMVKTLDDYGNLTPESICENPNYGNLIYDKYRNVYYRICYPQTEIEKGIKGSELYIYGRKNFSIIILDDKFNIIGETLFPDYTYNSKVLFILKDGLYISNSHYLNPNYSDDILSFQRFDLIKIV
jgi:hypothetical protein